MAAVREWFRLEPWGWLLFPLLLAAPFVAYTHQEIVFVLFAAVAILMRAKVALGVLLGIAFGALQNPNISDSVFAEAHRGHARIIFGMLGAVLGVAADRCSRK